jgi:DUF971 family protein
MAGLNPLTPIPTELKLHRKSGILNVVFNDGKSFSFSCEFLRVYSPSAEVRGHEPGQAILQTDKKNVTITHIEPIGRYAVRLDFSDGHNTGLYSWDLLYEYGLNQEAMWQDYLQRLEASGKNR